MCWVEQADDFVDLEVMGVVVEVEVGVVEAAAAGAGRRRGLYVAVPGLLWLSGWGCRRAPPHEGIIWAWPPSICCTYGKEAPCCRRTMWQLPVNLIEPKSTSWLLLLGTAAEGATIPWSSFDAFPRPSCCCC